MASMDEYVDEVRVMKFYLYKAGDSYFYICTPLVIEAERFFSKRCKQLGIAYRKDDIQTIDYAGSLNSERIVGAINHSIIELREEVAA